MTPWSVLAVLLAYFAAIFAVSFLSGRHKDGKEVFYTGGRNTHWVVVAFAMIGSCMSGVTYVSVPGMVGASGFGYLQMCIGFFLGYLVIAFVLTPLYFRLNVVSVKDFKVPVGTAVREIGFSKKDLYAKLETLETDESESYIISLPVQKHDENWYILEEPYHHGLFEGVTLYG